MERGEAIVHFAKVPKEYRIKRGGAPSCASRMTNHHEGVRFAHSTNPGSGLGRSISPPPFGLTTAQGPV